MPKFNEFIKGFEEKETATKPQEPKVETAPKAEEPKVETAPKVETPKVNGGKDHKVTRTSYNLSDKGEWEQFGEPEVTMVDKKYAGNVLSDTAQPFEQSHRLYKQGSGNQKYDTYESVSPDGKQKSVWRVEFPETKFEGSKQLQPAPQAQTPKAPEAPKTPEAPKPQKQVEFDPKKQYGGVAQWLRKAGFEPSEVNEEGGYIKVKNNEGKDYEIRGSRKPYEYNVFENGKQIYKGVPDSAVFENILSGKDLESFERYRASETPEQSPAEIASAHFGKEMTPTKWSENTFETDDGEEWFIGTEEEAREEAKEQIKSLADDMGLESFNPDFQDWILRNALDETFISDLQDEEADYLEGDGQMEEAEQIRSMSLDDFAEYLRGNYGDKEFSDLISRNNAIDWDKVAEEAIDWDGIAHFIASYDGEEEELPNGLFAYRIN